MNALAPEPNRGGSLSRFEAVKIIAVMDTALASPEGLTLNQAALDCRVSTDTARRYLNGLERRFCRLSGHPSGPYFWSVPGFRIFTPEAAPLAKSDS